MNRFGLFASLFAVLLGACGAPPAPTAAPAPAATAVQPTAPAVSPTPPSAPTHTPAATQDEPLTLTSRAFADGGAIPDSHTYMLPGQCDGENVSPPLSWTGAPAGAQSFAVIVVDPDGGDWVHWVQFNIPAGAAELPAEGGGPDLGVKGRNDFGELGYGGPCPPAGTHRYVFTLYALDTALSLPEGATRAEVEAAIDGHVLEAAQLTGLRSRE